VVRGVAADHTPGARDARDAAQHQTAPVVTGRVEAAEPLEPTAPDARPGADADAGAPIERTSRVLVIAFVLCLVFIGWLAVVGVDGAAALAHGLLDAGPGGCGGG